VARNLLAKLEAGDACNDFEYIDAISPGVRKAVDAIYGAHFAAQAIEAHAAPVPQECAPTPTNQDNNHD